jgi:hypothetical protein
MGHGLRAGGIGLASHVPPGLDQLSTYVEDTGEVKWVIKWGLDRDIPTPVTSISQQMLMAYRTSTGPRPSPSPCCATSTAATPSTLPTRRRNQAEPACQDAEHNSGLDASNACTWTWAGHRVLRSVRLSTGTRC